jgi:hypothetical protein
MSSGLPETLLQFVQAFVPTYQAAEVLLFFAAIAPAWSSQDLVDSSIRLREGRADVHADQRRTGPHHLRVHQGP